VQQDIETPSSIKELEFRLRTLSHDNQALKLIRDFSGSLKKTKHRQILFSPKGVLFRDPILYQDILAQNLISPEDDQFSLLQGDIVQTDNAYLGGEQIIGSKFAVVTSTCDLVLDRREYSALFLIQPICMQDPKAKDALAELLRFSSTQRMYLPPLPEDPPDVIANSVQFDGIVQARLNDLFLATRCASLSLVGWRIFGSLVRNILVRTSENEVKM
jgi:hypothetical protein